MKKNVMKLVGVATLFFSFLPPENCHLYTKKNYMHVLKQNFTYFFALVCKEIMDIPYGQYTAAKTLSLTTMTAKI